MKNAIFILTAAVMAISSLYSCQKNEKQMLLELSAESVQGQDGFTYVLTKNKFLTPFDIPVQELQSKFGKEASLADWNDLEANFGDDFSGFLQQIGLYGNENHEGIFITNDREYSFTMTRPYMITGKNNLENSSWIILKNLEDSRLIIVTQFDTGRVLLKVPIR
jgi:hypothetical protein